MVQTLDQIQVHQSTYATSINPVVIEKGRKKTDALTEHENHQLRALAGQLNWISNQTRPDLSFKTRQASIAASKGTINNIVEANKAVKKLQSEDVFLNFKSLGDLKKVEITAYSDASHANLRDASSQGGYIIFLQSEDGSVSPISWRSRKIRRVVRSTLAAETMALIEAAEQGFFIRSILVELLGICDSEVIPINILIDNRSLYDCIYSTKTIEDKRLLIDISCIRNKVENKEIHRITWVDSKNQLADCLTKNEASSSKLIEVLQQGYLHKY